MTPDDSRHGSHAGYRAGCRQQCCRDGAARYQRGLDYDNDRGIKRTHDARGVQRRVQALACLGWTNEDIGAACGHTGKWVSLVAHRTYVYAANHDLIAAAYDQLCMRVAPTSTRATRARARAARNGWAPPLSWDDIDHDDAPRGTRPTPRRSQVDPVVVDRILAGQVIACTVAEKRAALAAWTARGGSERSLCMAQGWKPGRYTKKEDAA